MMVPNAEHSLAGHAWDVMGSIAQVNVLGLVQI